MVKLAPQVRRVLQVHQELLAGQALMVSKVIRVSLAWTEI